VREPFDALILAVRVLPPEGRPQLHAYRRRDIHPDRADLHEYCCVEPVCEHREFDFQTYCWHASVMPIAALADLPGRCCPIAAALEVVGERWAMLIIREVALGNTRFQDIARGTGAPRDRIAARIKALEEAGALQRVPYQSAPPRFDYQLTDSGRALLPVLDALLAWGLDHAVAPDDPDRNRHQWTTAKHGAGRSR
jgi:DNA-binding HxlR family transcriptional regulator